MLTDLSQTARRPLTDLSQTSRRPLTDLSQTRSQTSTHAHMRACTRAHTHTVSLSHAFQLKHTMMLHMHPSKRTIDSSQRARQVSILRSSTNSTGNADRSPPRVSDRRATVTDATAARASPRPITPRAVTIVDDTSAHRRREELGPEGVLEVVRGAPPQSVMNFSSSVPVRGGGGVARVGEPAAVTRAGAASPLSTSPSAKLSPRAAAGETPRVMELERLQQAAGGRLEQAAAGVTPRDSELGWRDLEQGAGRGAGAGEGARAEATGGNVNFGGGGGRGKTRLGVDTSRLLQVG